MENIEIKLATIQNLTNLKAKKTMRHNKQFVEFTDDKRLRKIIYAYKCENKLSLRLDKFIYEIARCRVN